MTLCATNPLCYTNPTTTHHCSFSNSTIKPMCITLTHPLTKKPQTPKQRQHQHLHYSHYDEKMMNLSSPLRLPSPSQEKVGKRWKEYQGMRNWDGLLDPLDNNLRAEIIRYGHFVEVAYKSFQFDPSSPNYATCKFPKSTIFERCGLPNTGYKVTKHLRATSGIQLPTWVDKAPTWVSTPSSYVGYVAVCENKEEIKRLGRRDIVIAYRGTTTCLEWLENLRANLTHIPCNMRGDYSMNNEIGIGPMVESGFLSLYTSVASVNPSFKSLQETVRQEIERILQIYRGEPLSLTITGHSLGAALATLTAFDMRVVFPKSPPVTVISFGGPRVGNKSFRKSLDRQGTKVLRIVNSDDVITKVPGFVFDDTEKNCDVESKRRLHVAGFPSWIQKQVEEAQWLYSEVGEELRLSSRDSPYLSGVNVATCHDLNTYLHLVDGFVSSNCPFRATAKRFLHR